MKKFIKIITALLIITSASVNVSAALINPGNQAVPLWDYMENVSENGRY